MADDVKIGIGIDLSELEKEIEKGTQLFQQKLGQDQQARQQNSIFTNPSSPQAQSLNKQDLVLKSLTSQFEKLLKTLENFTSVQEKQTNKLKQETDSQEPSWEWAVSKSGRRYKKYHDAGPQESFEEKERRFLGTGLPHGIYAGMNAMAGVHAGGGTESSVLSGVGDVAMMGARYTPWALPVAGALKAWSVSAADTEKWSDLRANLFREAGEDARKALFMAQMSGPDSPMSMERWGLSDEETAQLFRGYGRGVGDFTFKGTPTGTGGFKVDPSTGLDNLKDLMKLQGVMGLGTEGINLLGATERTGGMPKDIDIIGSAIGVAMASELERGRFGEAFDNLTKAAQSITHGQADIKAIATGETFISLLGKEYAGATGAHGAAQQTLQQLASGQGGGFSSFMALKAAGFGEGKDYFSAQLSLARGLDAKGGVSTESIVKQYAEMPMYKAMWQRGAKEQAAVLIARATGTNAGTVFDILNGYYSGKMDIAQRFDEISAKGRGAFEDLNQPSYDYKTRKKKVETTREGAFNAYGGQLQSVMDSFGEKNLDPWGMGLSFDPTTGEFKSPTPRRASGMEIDFVNKALGISPTSSATPSTSSGEWAPYESDDVLPYGYRYYDTHFDNGKWNKKGMYKKPLTQSEREAIIDTAARLGIPASRLYMMMYSESMGDPRSVNEEGLGGLVGFGSAFAKSQGTTVEEIRKLSFEEQTRKYVYELYKDRAAKGKLDNVGDLKMSAFFGAALGKPDSTVIMSASGYSDFQKIYQAKADARNKKKVGGRTNWTAEDIAKDWYNQNTGHPGIGNIGKGSDRNSDGQIDVGEVRKNIEDDYQKEMQKQQKKKAKEGARSSLDEGTINLLIRVEDSRLTITQAASMRNPGIPGQHVLIPGVKVG